jgi:nucleotide-binding universal stress UspA family protein
MGIKILIAFDDSENALRAVETVARLFKNDARVVLFHAAMDTVTLCNMNSPELTPYFKSQQSTFCTMEDKKKELVEHAMKQARQILLDKDFSEDNILLKMEPIKSGVARDIIDQAEASGYDMIVLGRRGASGVKDFFFGNTSQKVLSAAKDVSILVVD